MNKKLFLILILDICLLTKSQEKEEEELRSCKREI